jgi:hypothetical protein
MDQDNNNHPPTPGLTHTFQCKACGKPITAELPPPDKCAFLNTPIVSSMIVVHESPTVCPHCNLTYAPVMIQVAPSWRFEAFEKASPAGLIVPAGGKIVSFRKPN